MKPNPTMTRYLYKLKNKVTRNHQKCNSNQLTDVLWVPIMGLGHDAWSFWCHRKTRGHRPHLPVDEQLQILWPTSEASYEDSPQRGWQEGELTRLWNEWPQLWQDLGASALFPSILISKVLSQHFTALGVPIPHPHSPSLCSSDIIYNTSDKRPQNEKGGGERYFASKSFPLSGRPSPELMPTQTPSNNLKVL